MHEAYGYQHAKNRTNVGPGVSLLGADLQKKGRRDSCYS